MTQPCQAITRNTRKRCGTIVSIGGYIIVDFGSRTAQYQTDAVIKDFLRLADEELQKDVDAEIARIAKEEAEETEKRRIAREEASKKAEEERARKAAEEAEKQRKKDEAARNRNSGKKSGPIHPYIDKRRAEGKPVIFMVCQNDNYDVEANGGYIWAPDKTPGKTDPASWAEMDYVKEGDIVIHHFGNRIWALSVAKKDCERKAATSGHPNVGQVGRYVELSYHFLANPADTSGLKAEKIAYGSMKYGPFEKTGKNKEGFYLSELADEIATVFMDAAIAANPTDADLPVFRSKI